MKEINVLKLLTGCPKGMPLYCDIAGKVKFDHISDDVITTLDEYDTEYQFTKNGALMYCGKLCVLWPNDSRTWEGFELPRPVREGDWIVINGDKVGHISHVYDDRFSVLARIPSLFGEMEISVDRNEIEPWRPYMAEKGDFLFIKKNEAHNHDSVMLFRQDDTVSDHYAKAFCYYNLDDDTLCFDDGASLDIWNSVPATMSQISAFEEALKRQANLKWNPETEKFDSIPTENTNTLSVVQTHDERIVALEKRVKELEERINAIDGYIPRPLGG